VRTKAQTDATLLDWQYSQIEYIRNVYVDWLGTGQSETLAAQMYESLASAVLSLRGATDLWLDPDKHSLNGAFGSIQFGVVAHRAFPRNASPELKQWIEDSDPLPPFQWTFHS
jgi:hypothetical protein